MKKLLILILFCVFSVNIVIGQTKSELEKKKKQTEADIELTSKLLKQTSINKQQQYNNLLIIKKRISLRQKLINTINSEIVILEKGIVEKSNLINTLEKKLVNLKEEYAKLIYYSFKNKNKYDIMMFILSSENFNQAYRRIKYFEQYSEYRKKQAELISNTVKTLEIEISELKKEKQEKEKLIDKKLIEKNNLRIEKIQENRQVLSLKLKEKELKHKIRKIEKTKRKIEKEINDLIAREAKKNSYYKELNLSEAELSNQFYEAKGKHIWPVKNGLVIQTFGVHNHPVIKGIKINSEGIDIRSSQKNNVVCIFDGIVKKIFAIPGANMSVIVRHGHYLTLYSNIVNVKVKVGNKIKKNELIGEVYNSIHNEDSKVLHFRVYKENKTLNPELWLAN
ncbi:MAG: peptidoglycan DD-metalloendopeptidase family protein [Bacteroidota bacterium]|nr:peptidoglycan DD-metalloendopeptidase family protein [Bacteroidota bacterium]